MEERPNIVGVLQRWSASQQAELDPHGVAGVLDLPDGPGEL
jgi:hypothetical protein